MTFEEGIPRRAELLLKGFSIFIAMLSVGYIWLLVEFGFNILNVIALLFAILMTITAYIAGSESTLKRLNVSWDWVWTLVIVCMIGTTTANHAGTILDDIRSGRSFDLASLDGYMLVLFVGLFLATLLLTVYHYYRGEPYRVTVTMDRE
jgi:hypothetical protein